MIISVAVLLFAPFPLSQVIAYNKVDVPDSGDYWEFVKEYLRVSTHTYKHVRLSLVLSLSLCLDRRIAYQPASHQPWNFCVSLCVQPECEPLCSPVCEPVYQLVCVPVCAVG